MNDANTPFNKSTHQQINNKTKTMKTRRIFQSLLLFMLLTMAGGFSAKAQEDSCAVNVIHTYVNGRLVPWDSVEVRVCLPPCDGYPYHYQIFKMYWPDTILSNCATRIDEYVAADKLELSQNYPNPCQGESSVRLTTRTSGSVRLQVMDVQGRLCCQRTETLPAGEHTLSLTFPHSGLYFVTAETADGRETCKVLCSEGKGSAFSIRPSSTSPQIVEKAERGGEGMFGMTDKMVIRAYLTYNGAVKNSSVVVNTTDYVEGYEFSTWIYKEGAINIFMNDIDTSAQLELAGNTFQLIVSSQTCLPFMDIPLGYTITFGDSTLYSVTETFFPYTSSTWHFSGWYKYQQSGEVFIIRSMNDALSYNRRLFATSNRDAVIYIFNPYLSGEGYERLILKEMQPAIHVSDVNFSGCLGKSTRSDTVSFQYENDQLNVLHHLTLNCAAANVLIRPVISNNTLDITYLVDDNISANCVCPTQLEYTIDGLPSGTYNIIIRLGNTILYQQEVSL